MKYGFILLLVVFGQNTCGQTVLPTTVTVRFHTYGRTLFNYIDKNDLSTALEFKNPGHADTSVRYTLDIGKPLHFHSANILVITDGEPVIEHRTLLVLPGDSLVVDQQSQQVVYSRYGVYYLDTIIDSKRFYEMNMLPTIKKIKAGGLEPVLDDIQQQYLATEQRIKDNASRSHPRFLAAQHALNYIWKIKAISDISVNTNPLAPAELALLDSLFKEAETNFDSLAAVKIPLVYSVLYAQVTHKAYRQGIRNADFWDYFQLASPRIRQSELYKAFLLNKMNADYNTNKRVDKLARLVTEVKRAGITDDRYNALLQTKTALQEEMAKQIFTMQQYDGRQTEYAALLARLKGRYVFVDFWASWCGPCRKQMPYLRPLRKELKEKNIEFVSISIDNDDQVDDWKAASKDEGLNKDAFSFRLLKGNKNQLLKILEINSVPRYFLYNPKGDLVSGHFMTPDKKEFKAALLNEMTR